MIRLALAVILASAAPATAQVSPPANATAKIAGLFDAPPAGKGQIVFFRAYSPGVGCMVREGEKADELHLSKLTNNRYFLRVVEPGPHRYWAKNFTKDTANLEVEPGETYFVRCEIAIGLLSSNPNLVPSSAEAFDAVKDKLEPMAPQ